MKPKILQNKHQYSVQTDFIEVFYFYMRYERRLFIYNLYIHGSIFRIFCRVLIKNKETQCLCLCGCMDGSFLMSTFSCSGILPISLFAIDININMLILLKYYRTSSKVGSNLYRTLRIIEVDYRNK